MRSLIFTLACALPIFLSAQIEQDQNPYIHVQEGAFAFASVSSGDNVPVYQIDVDMVRPDELQESLYDFFRKNTDLKPQVVENEMAVPGVVVKKVREKPFDIYTHVQETREGSRVYVGVRDSTGFIKPDHPDYGLTMERVVKMRINEVVVDALERRLKKEEDILDDFEDELDDIRDDIDDNQKDIQRNEQKIIEKEQKVSALQAQTEQLLGTLTNQRTSMARATSKEEEKSLKSSVRDLEKEIKRTNKDIENLNEDKYDLQSEIRDLKFEIAKLTEKRDSQAAKISEQTEKVRQIKEEIEGIKRLM
ncbi:MAG: hypothetical protein LPK47_08765 [Bacteroidota bacterium]|nr:hypothetical protein [Bacteroidota bacterium]